MKTLQSTCIDGLPGILQMMKRSQSCGLGLSDKVKNQHG